MTSLYTLLIGFFGTAFIFALVSLTPQKSLSDIPRNTLIVAELFTSQSCSSCPAADKVLAELSENKNIITLSCHVTYWNHLHWKDTLSEDFCTSRQRTYARQISDTSRVYTPQLVVNGTYETVGSRREKVADIIQQASLKDSLVPLYLDLKNKTLTINYPALSNPPYRTYIFGYKDRHIQQISSGENKGRTVNYTNAVRDLRDLGPWDGKVKTITVDLSPLYSQDIHGFVVILQQMRTGQIEAASRLRF